MHRGAYGWSREDIVKQVVDDEKSVSDYKNYIPIGNAEDKLKAWTKQGAEIVYLSSHQTEADVAKDRLVLKRYDFPEGQVFYRKDGENYVDLVEKILPDILIEDDCESIGGEGEMIYPNLPLSSKRKIRSIVVKEFARIDDLADEIKI
jgi:hypothetical protein